MTSTEAVLAPTFEEGDLLRGFERVLTHERALWYGDGLMTSAGGVRQLAQTNIHTDDDFARGQGLPGAIADGMHSTNWISSMLVQEFGQAYLVNSELRTKYIKPTFVGKRLKVCGRIRAKKPLDDGGTRYEIDVWTEDPDGQLLTVGEAIVQVPTAA